MASNRNLPNATFNRLDVIKEKINTIQNKIDENSNKIDEIELELNNVSKSVEILFTRLYENNNKIDSDDTVSGIYLNGGFIISSVFRSMVIIIKNIKRSRDQNKDIYDIYEINIVENKLKLNLTIELITDENGVKSFIYLDTKYVFIKDDLAVNTYEDTDIELDVAYTLYFKRISNPEQEIGKFLNQYKTTFEEYNTKKNMQITSDLSLETIWKKYTKYSYGTNNIDNEYENAITGERIKTNCKKYTSTELLSFTDRLYFNDENIYYRVKNIKSYKTFGEVKGRLIQNTIEFDGNYNNYFTINEFSYCKYQDVTITGSIDDDFNNKYENFTYKVSCYDRCSSQPFKDFITTNTFNFRAPIRVERDSTITITCNFSDSYENGFNNTVTINFKRGLYYTEDISDTINYNIRFKTNASVMMYLNSPSRYTDLKNDEAFRKINSSHFSLAQPTKKGIIRTNSVSITTTGDIGKIMDISDGEYTFEKNNDNISTIPFGDHPVLFTSIENMNFECNDNSKIVHMRKKVNGSENPNILIDNLCIYKIFTKWELHNLNLYNVQTTEYREVSIPNNYPDYKSAVENELTENYRYIISGDPIMCGMNRDLGKDSNSGFTEYGKCGLNGQDLAGIYGYTIAKKISDKEYETLTDYFSEICKVTNDGDDNFIVKNYYETTENDVELIQYGHFIAIVNPAKQPDGYKNVTIGLISLRSFLYQNMKKVKGFFQAIIKFFNSKNVTKVIFDVGYNPGGYITNSFITMTSTTKTDYNIKSLAGVLGNEDNITQYLGNDDLINFMKSLPDNEKDKYVKAGLKIELAEKYTYEDENGDIFEKSTEFEEELNANVFLVFLNNSSFSASQLLAIMFKTISKFTNKVICRTAGGSSAIFGTGGVNLSNLDQYNEGTIIFSTRFEASTFVAGKDKIAIDDSSNYYNRIDYKFNITNEQYLKDCNVSDDGVIDDDKKHTSSEIDFMIETISVINNE